MQTSVRTAILFMSHLVTPGVVRQFETLRRACPPHATLVWLMHAPPGRPVPAALRDIPHHFATTTDIRTPEYPAKSGGPGWSFHVGGHTDLPVLHFFRQRPEFERYWYIEYDVRFSGRWEAFFAAFEESGADLLTTTLRTAEVTPHWWLWFKFGMPEGGGAVAPEFRWERRTGAFMPVFRASRRAMETMDAAYREGWSGHLEVTWPSILREAGLALEDIGGDGAFTAPANRGRFYGNTMTDAWYRPGTFVFRPLKWPVPRLRRDVLWHPVKTLEDSVRETYWNLCSRAWRGRRESEEYGTSYPSDTAYRLDFVRETDDHLAYRAGREPGGPLSTRGEYIMCSLLRSGMADEEVGERMTVPAEVVAVRRRGWGRELGEVG